MLFGALDDEVVFGYHFADNNKDFGFDNSKWGHCWPVGRII